MKVVVIFIIVVPGLSLQQHYYIQTDSYSRELDESRQSRALDYDQSPYGSASRRHRHKKHTSREEASAELDVNNEKYIGRSEKHSHRRPKGHLRRYKKGYYDNCVCDCMKCDDLQQCCQSVCSNECEQPEQNNQVEQPGLSPGNLVFVPYPYPLVVPPPAPLMPLLPMLPPTTVKCITTSTALSISNHEVRHARRHSEPVDKDSYLDLLRTLRYRKELPFSRDRLSDMRPGKRYIPEYGVISDHLMDRLMSQVRNVKDIQSTMDH